MSTPAVIGIDLSLTGLGLCAIPPAWSPDSRLSWFQIRRIRLGTDPGKPLVARADALAQDVVRWIMRLAVPAANGDWDPRWLTDTKVCHEGYPIGGRAYNLDKLCELGGIVKLALWSRLKLETWAAPQSTARKLICGMLPRKDRKAITIAEARRMALGAFDDASDDEVDAFVAANCYRRELGLRHVFTPEPPKVKKPSKRRSRTQVGQLVLGESR